jgi:amino-acid N-acetyltransferase
MTTPAIRPVSNPEGVLGLLHECGLPTSDLDAAQFEHFLICGAGDQPGGVIGLELHGAHGLLRSLAVSPTVRSEGCGSALVAAIESQACALGLDDLYLLTETAEEFFAARGYVAVRRDLVPDAIRATAEFSTLCPDSAVVMCKVL